MLEAKQMLTSGGNHDDRELLLLAQGAFEQATADDSLSILAHYYAASAASQLANILVEMDPPAEKRDILRHVNYAIDHLQKATQQDAAFAEGWLMLGAAYAQKLTANPISALSTGPKFSGQCRWPGSLHQIIRVWS